jgi:hypothetical protein
MTPLPVPLLAEVNVTQLNELVAVQVQMLLLAVTVIMLPAPPEFVNVACCGLIVIVQAVKVAVTLPSAGMLPRVQTPVPVQTLPRLVELLHPTKKEPLSGTASRTFPEIGTCVTPNWHGGLPLSKVIPPVVALQFTVPEPVPGLVTLMAKP